MYEHFAEVYDILNKNANYLERTNYVLKLFKKFDRKPSLLLDLACGTGSFTNEFLKQDVDVIGVDSSQYMLSCAREKSNALFICQKAEELELFGTVDGAICMLDSINHITTKKALKKVFERVHLFLEPERLFIFDINTPFKHKEILANNAFNFNQSDFFVAWQNEALKNGTHIYIDIFKKNGESYNRFSEDFYERAYSIKEIEELLTKTGFKVLAKFDDLSENVPHNKSERIYFVAKRIEK